MRGDSSGRRRRPGPVSGRNGRRAPRTPATAPRVLSNRGSSSERVRHENSRPTSRQALASALRSSARRERARAGRRGHRRADERSRARRVREPDRLRGQQRAATTSTSTRRRLIEEEPPQERPADTEWVPGYWSYDDDSRNWMWVSGTWRATPPGYVWVSGYWIKTWKGWRYVRGYWAPVGYGTTEIVYLPPPPPTLESGPIGYAPWVNAIWIPGTWIWVSGGYLGWMWQSGYWIVYNPDWTWVPATYAWTPYGYIFVPGALRPLVRAPRLPLRPGLLPAPVVPDRRVLVSPVVRDQRLGVQRLLLHAAVVLPLLLRRLLRRDQLEPRDLPGVLLPVHEVRV